VVRTSQLRVGSLLYCVGADGVYGILVQPDGQSGVFDIGSTVDLQPKAAALVSALGDGVPARARYQEVDRFVYEWGPALLPPGLADAGLDVLVIVPHHFLHGVPVHALRLGSSPLAVQMGVSYCSSISVMEHSMGRNPCRLGPAWDFALSDGETSHLLSGPPERRCVSYGGDVVTGMPGYQEVADSFSAHFSGCLNINPYVGSITPRVSARSALKLLVGDTDFRVVCVVCHGFVDDVMPELSGLLVGGSEVSRLAFDRELSPGVVFRVHDYPFRFPPAELPRRDGGVEVLTALELAAGKSPVTELACLFGCSTARGEPMAFDDVASVAYQWLKTGTGTVLASMWELDVEVLASWVPRFLRNWLDRCQPKAIAWREAMRSLLDEQPTLPTAEWAVIALLGDWL
jgi:hypothetical protein